MISRISCGVVLLCVWSILVDSQLIPSSPCPDVFTYVNDGRQTFGMIHYQPTGRQKTIVLKANFSIKATLPSNYFGQLEVIGAKQQVLQSVQRGWPLKYRVHFPLASPLPRLVAIIINEQILCYGSPEIAGPGESITNLSLHHRLFSNGASSESDGGGPDFAPYAPPERPPAPARPRDPEPPYDDGNRFQINPQSFNNHEEEPSFIINTVTFPNRPQQYYPLELSPPPRANYSFDTQQASVPFIQRPQVVVEQIPLRPVLAAVPVVGPVECGTVAGGSDRVALVYHGSAVSRGDWPWLVAMYVRHDSGLQFTCAGTLVSNQHVVTAAHCMQNRNTLTAMRDIVVKVGAFSLDDWSDDNVVTRSLSAAHLHFSYNAQTLENDILILKLDKPVHFSNFIRPACLWEGNTDLSIIVGQSGTVVGWGGNEVGPSGHGEPRMGQLPVVSTETCRASRVEFHKLTSTNTLCAGDRNGAGPCNGDSGGGLYMMVGGRWRLRGVVSVSLRPVTGEAVCNLDEFVVFTDTAQYLPWLRQRLAA